jgi:hypothetical protein
VTLPNFIAAPHVADVTREAVDRMGIAAVENILTSSTASRSAITSSMRKCWIKDPAPTGPGEARSWELCSIRRPLVRAAMLGRRRLIGGNLFETALDCRYDAPGVGAVRRRCSQKLPEFYLSVPDRRVANELPSCLNSTYGYLGMADVAYPSPAQERREIRRKSMTRKIREYPHIVTIAIIILWGSTQPSYSQNSGIGGDGFTRLLWTGTDGSIVLYKLDGNLNPVATRGYGPFADWAPIGLTVANNSFSCVLWRRTDGLVNIWLVDPNLNLAGNQTYGPFAGWYAEHLSADTNGLSTLRLTWTATNGTFSVWYLQPNLALSISNTFGPFFGYLPGR